VGRFEPPERSVAVADCRTNAASAGLLQVDVRFGQLTPSRPEFITATICLGTQADDRPMQCAGMIALYRAVFCAVDAACEVVK
jgi:hypothetical protein